MKLSRIPASLWTLTAENGDPLLLYGHDEAGNLMLWPTPYIERHRFAFARYCKRHIGQMRGTHAILNHPLCAKTERWARWLGVTLEPGVARV